VIDASRFIAQSRNRDEWLEARKGGVTATEVAKAATPAGYIEALDQRMFPTEIIANDVMVFGSESEAELMRYAHREHGILASDWLIASEAGGQYLATPDGISVDHSTIAECKTGGTIPKSVPRAHRDQCQWQLFVSGAERCLYVFQQRVPDDAGWFYFGLLEPITFWIDRDDTRIGQLIEVADRLIGESHGL